MLSRQAFDALLKILEEPPPHAVFVLATTELQDVPDTIKSRVQIFPFRLIPVGLVEERLRHVCESEGVAHEPGSLRLVAEAGQGSMRDALTTLDRVISAGDGQVAEALVREQLGVVPAVRVMGALESLLAGDARAVLDHCDALGAMGADWASFWKELMLALRGHIEATVRSGAGPHELLRLARMLDLLLRRERDLRDSGLPQVVVELALVTASQLPHVEPLDSLARAQGGAPAGPAAPTAARRQAPPGSRPQQPPPHQPAPHTRQPPPAPPIDPNDLVRQEPNLERLLEDVSGEIVEIR
jgi:DNA polymerase-3 subunit gamma/tau